MRMVYNNNKYRISERGEGCSPNRVTVNAAFSYSHAQICFSSLLSLEVPQ